MRIREMGGIIMGLIVLLLYGAGIILLALGALINYMYQGIKWLLAKRPATEQEHSSKSSSNQNNKANTQKIPAETMAKVTEREAFEDAILEVGYLRDYNYRFREVEDKAYGLIARYSDSGSFLDDVMHECYSRKDFASEIIWFIASMVKDGSSTDQIDLQLRPYFISHKSLALPKFIPEQFSAVPKSASEEKQPNPPATTNFSKDELAEFRDTIYIVKFLGHEDPRFETLALKTHNLIDEYGNSSSFYDDIIDALSKASDPVSEAIVDIVRQKKRGLSDVELVKKLREKYLNRREYVENDPGKIHRCLQKSNHQKQYVEADLSEASKS